jgi:hypothetical protein
MPGLLRGGVGVPILVQVVGYSAGLFVCCMVCHGELVRLKPAPRHLTAFYLLVAAGGAAGGVFVTLVAPAVFHTYLELHIGLWACCALAMATFWVDKRPHRYWPRPRRRLVAVSLYLLAPVLVVVFRPFGALGMAGSRASGRMLLGAWVLCGLAAVALWAARKPARYWRSSWVWVLCLPAFVAGLLLLGAELHVQARESLADAVAVSRNFYGVLRVTEHYPEAPRRHHYVLRHGRVIHGCQLLSAEGRRRAITYYAEPTGVGLLFRHHPRRAAGLHVGVIGLGAGALAAWGREGDRFRFYEINPDVESVATTWFTYLADTPADCTVVLGDARLSLEREERQGFDVLVLDAFSGDAIPVHLLTREAFAVYLRHLEEDGVLAAHISNGYLDLAPVVAALAERFGLAAVQIDTAGDREHDIVACTWVLLARDPALLAQEALRAAGTELGPRRILWTDGYSDLFRILK